MPKCEFKMCSCQGKGEAVAEWLMPLAHPSHWSRACEEMDGLCQELKRDSDATRKLAEDIPELKLGPPMERREL